MTVISNNIIDDYHKIEKDFILNIGNFDGFHSGHQQIINKTDQIAKTKNYKKAIITFSNKPAALFEKKFINTQIFPLESKIDYLKKLKEDFVFIFEFNSDLRNMNAIEFVEFLLSNKYLKEIVVGENFTFGKEKSGNAKLLKNLMEKKDVKVSIIPLMYSDGQLVSSTMIRQHILSGDLSINKYLIEPFYILGLVEAGKHFGRLIQFPTANIYIYDQIRPKPAVYATITSYKEDENIKKNRYDFSMTFVGLNGEIETHIFDKKINLYNKEIKVYFIKYMRDIIKIESLTHLEKVLKDDRKKVLKYFQSLAGENPFDAKLFLKNYHRSIINVFE
ncbi:MAG: riboflavin biosynthesis protein RibF [Exilispira sp.]